MDTIKITHLGEDYGTVEIDNIEYECSLHLAVAIKSALKRIKVQASCAHQFNVRGQASRMKHCVKCGLEVKEN